MAGFSFQEETGSTWGMGVRGGGGNRLSQAHGRLRGCSTQGRDEERPEDEGMEVHLGGV